MHPELDGQRPIRKEAGVATTLVTARRISRTSDAHAARDEVPHDARYVYDRLVQTEVETSVVHVGLAHDRRARRASILEGSEHAWLDLQTTLTVVPRAIRLRREVRLSSTVGARAICDVVLPRSEVRIEQRRGAAREGDRVMAVRKRHARGRDLVEKASTPCARDARFDLARLETLRCRRGVRREELDLDASNVTIRDDTQRTHAPITAEAVERETAVPVRARGLVRGRLHEVAAMRAHGLDEPSARRDERRAPRTLEPRRVRAQGLDAERRAHHLERPEALATRSLRRAGEDGVGVARSGLARGAFDRQLLAEILRVTDRLGVEERTTGSALDGVVSIGAGDRRHRRERTRIGHGRVSPAPRSIAERPRNRMNFAHGTGAAMSPAMSRARLASLLLLALPFASLALPAHATPRTIGSAKTPTTSTATATVDASQTTTTTIAPTPDAVSTETPAPSEHDAFATHLRDGRTISGLSAHRALHFTFDDGPSEHTPALLDVLEARGVRATFFLVARQLEHERGRRIAREIMNRGHTIGLHSYRHDDLTTLDAVALRRDLDRSERIYEDVFEARPFLFRPPYGRHDVQLDTELATRGYTQVLWNITTTEGHAHSSEEVVEGFVTAMDRQERMSRGAGGVIVFHDTHRWVVEAMPAIFDELDRRNCVAVSEGEELWDVHADLTAWHEPRGRAASTRSARRMRMDEETSAARQAELATRTAERCVAPSS